MRYGQCHYRTFEEDKTNALKQEKGNVDATMSLSSPAKEELHWWLQNLPLAFNYVKNAKVNLIINSDASCSGWGAVWGSTSETKNNKLFITFGCIYCIEILFECYLW